MLINCAAYQDGRKLGDIRKEEIRDYLSRPGSFVWVALKDSTPEELAEMQQAFGLHELAVEDASHGHQRPKLEEYGDSLFVVVQTVEAIGDELNVGELSIFAGRNYLLSVRNRTEQGFTNVRQRTEREPHLLKLGSGFVLYALIDTVVDRYFPVLDGLEDELERLEERIFAGTPSRENIESLYALKQKLTTLKHAAGPLQETTGKLYGGRVPEICAGTQDYFRDVYEHIIQVIETMETNRDVIAGLVDVYLSSVSNRMNEIMKVLTVITTLFIPLTFITGLYGMNFAYMPGLNARWGYPVVLVLMFGVFSGMLVYFRNRKWF